MSLAVMHNDKMYHYNRGIITRNIHETLHLENVLSWLFYATHITLDSLLNSMFFFMWHIYCTCSYNAEWVHGEN